GGSLQNTSLIPLNLQVSSSYTGSNGVTVSGSSATDMTIYAPGTDVQITGGGPFYGALVGKTLTISGGSSLHQDLALPDVWGVFGPKRKILTRWGRRKPALLFCINILCKEAAKTRSV